jgi:hypothetical protein
LVIVGQQQGDRHAEREGCQQVMRLHFCVVSLSVGVRGCESLPTNARVGDVQKHSPVTRRP